MKYGILSRVVILKTGISREDLARRKPRALDKCEATNSQKGIWRSREVPIYILQDGLLPETIQGGKGAFKNKRGKNMVKLG